MKRSFWLLIVILACLPGCGRKLPPAPPGTGDPVAIRAIDIEDDSVRLEVRCRAPQGRLILLGKPKGICPHCTDDLTRRDARECARRVVLVDAAPEAGSMVYRVALEAGGAVWLSDPRIVNIKR